MKQAVNLRRFQPDQDLIDVARAPAPYAAKRQGAAANVTTYTIPTSICSQRVRMTLCEKGVPFHDRTVKAAEGENLTPEYIKINPRALMPAMTFDDRSIFDSAVMMCFINNYFAGPELAPEEPGQFALMNDWIKRSDDFPIRGFHYRSHLASGRPDYLRPAMYDNVIRARELYPEYREIYDLKLQDWADLETYLQSPQEFADGEQIAFGIADDAERALEETQFLIGDTITLADITIFLLLMRLQCGVGLRLWVPESRPNLVRYMERMKWRPAYNDAVLQPFRTGGVPFDGKCWA